MGIRFKHSIKNIIWDIIYNCESVIFNFIIKAVIIQKFGAEYLGLSSLYISILGTLNIAELGFDTVLLYMLYKPFAEKDIKTVNAILYLYKKICHIIGGIILFLGIVVSVFLPKLINGHFSNNLNIYIIYYFYLIQSVISYFISSYRKMLFKVSQQLDIQNKITACAFFFMYVLQLVGLIVFHDYYFYAITLPLTSIGINCAHLIVSKRLYASYKPEGMLSKDLYDHILQKLGPIVLSKVRNISRLYIDTVFLSVFFGLVITAQYNIYITLRSTLIVFIYLFIANTKESMGNFFSTEKKEIQYSVFFTYSFVIVWLSAWAAICFLCLVNDVVILWVGEKMLLNFSAVLAFTFFIYVQIFSSILESVKDITGTYWENRYSPLLEMSANIVLNFILIQLFGVTGIVVATVLCITFITILSDIHIIFKYYFIQNPKEYILFFLLFSILAILTGYFTYYLCGFTRLLSPFLGLVIRLCICIVIPNIIFLCCYRQTKTFKEVVKILQSLKLKRKST